MYSRPSGTWTIILWPFVANLSFYWMVTCLQTVVCFGRSHGSSLISEVVNLLHLILISSAWPLSSCFLFSNNLEIIHYSETKDASNSSSWDSAEVIPIANITTKHVTIAYTCLEAWRKVFSGCGKFLSSSPSHGPKDRWSELVHESLEILRLLHCMVRFPHMTFVVLRSRASLNHWVAMADTDVMANIKAERWRELYTTTITVCKQVTIPNLHTAT